MVKKNNKKQSVSRERNTKENVVKKEKDLSQKGKPATKGARPQKKSTKALTEVKPQDKGANATSAGARPQKKSQKAPASKPSKSLLSLLGNIPGIYRVSDSELRTIMSYDARIVSSNTEKYMRDNITLYDFAITCWEHMIADYMSHSNSLRAGAVTNRLVRAMLRGGLFFVIKAANDISDSLISCNCDLSLLFIEIERKVYDDNFTLSVWHDLLFIVHELRDADSALQVLRFLKRFSPSDTDLLEEENIKSFLSVEKDCSYINRRMFAIRNTATYQSAARSYSQLTAVQRRINRMVGISVTPEFSPMMHEILALAQDECHAILVDYEEQHGYFSNGSINDGQKSPAAKLQAALCKDEGFLDNPSLEQAAHTLVPKDCAYTYECEYSTVPKNHKGRRGIAVEEAGRNYRMQGIRKGLRRALKAHGVDLDDQSINQRAAKFASECRYIATVDLSSASDRIAYGVVRYLFAQDMQLWNQMKNLRARYVIINNKRYPIEKFATSGSPLCFEVESLVFISILRACASYAKPWMTEEQWHLCERWINTYGDDIIIPSFLFDLVSTVFDRLNFVLNTDKTHWALSDPYRESCGEEYVNGENISSRYFPRKQIEFSSGVKKTVTDHPETIVSLCSLQHRIVGCEILNDYVSQVIKMFVPDMTESFIGSDYSDIWSDAPVISYSDKFDRPKEGNPQPDKRPMYDRLMEEHYSLVSVHDSSVRVTPEIKALANILAYQSALATREVEAVPGPYDVAIVQETSSVSSLAGTQKEVLRKILY